MGGRGTTATEKDMAITWGKMLMPKCDPDERMQITARSMWGEIHLRTCPSQQTGGEGPVTVGTSDGWGATKHGSEGIVKLCGWCNHKMTVDQTHSMRPWWDLRLPASRCHLGEQKKQKWGIPKCEIKIEQLLKALPLDSIIFYHTEIEIQTKKLRLF